MLMIRTREKCSFAYGRMYKRILAIKQSKQKRIRDICSAGENNNT
jgi:hypothetical protein